MPIYEYQCESCNHEFEALQKLSDPRLTDCPACQTASLRKKVSAAGFRLKGGGWYETDFKTGNRKNVAGESGGDGGGSGTGDKAGKSDSKGGDSSPGSGKNSKAATA